MDKDIKYRPLEKICRFMLDDFQTSNLSSDKDTWGTYYEGYLVHPEYQDSQVIPPALDYNGDLVPESLQDKGVQVFRDFIPEWADLVLYTTIEDGILSCLYADNHKHLLVEEFTKEIENPCFCSDKHKHLFRSYFFCNHRVFKKEEDIKANVRKGLPGIRLSDTYIASRVLNITNKSNELLDILIQNARGGFKQYILKKNETMVYEVKS